MVWVLSFAQIHAPPIPNCFLPVANQNLYALRPFFDGGYEMLVAYLHHQKLKNNILYHRAWHSNTSAMIKPCAWSYLLKCSMLRSIHTHTQIHETMQRMSLHFQYLGKQKKQLQSTSTHFKLYEDHFFPRPMALFTRHPGSEVSNQKKKRRTQPPWYHGEDGEFPSSVHLRISRCPGVRWTQPLGLSGE